MRRLFITLGIVTLTAGVLLASDGAGQSTSGSKAEGDSLMVSGSQFNVQTDIQGLYDEISQATLQFACASDVDLFHDVMYTSDWVFVDLAGQSYAWPQMRDQALRVLSAMPDSITQPIQTLSIDADGVSVVVRVTTIRTVNDLTAYDERAGDSHTVTDTTVFRDRWVRMADRWKMKSRTQITRPTITVDQVESLT